MTHAITRAIFLKKRRGLYSPQPRVRDSRRFRAIFLVLTGLLGSTPIVQAATATWNPNPEPDIAGYILSYGTLPGVHPTSVDVGNVTTCQVTTLTPGQIYYFVLQAYNTSGLVSAPSAEVVFTAPLASPPSLTSLTPTAGPAGTAVTIVGANFGTTQSTSTVTFNGTTATPSSWSATSIGVPVPVGASTGTVVVTVGGVASNGISFTVTAPAPSLTGLTPTSGAVGTPVTIAGANFGTTQGTSRVKFNGTTATPTSWSATSIVVPVPIGATTGTVVVTVGGVASNGAAFTVASKPSAPADLRIVGGQ
jgi:hypothetical protein